MKSRLKTALRAALLGSTALVAVYAARAATSSPESEVIPLRKAEFRIPFTIDSRGTTPAKVQLWVSTDQGTSWQLHGSQLPTEKSFKFRAAAQGEYQFLVQSVDEEGVAYPSTAPPMRVLIDTQKPEVEMDADLTAAGQLRVDLAIVDEHLDPQTGKLKLRTNLDAEWQTVSASQLAVVPGRPGAYRLKQLVEVGNCRDVSIVFVIKDTAGNSAEATFKYEMPRTASRPGMAFASTDEPDGITRLAARPGEGYPPTIPGSTSWVPAAESTLAVGRNQSALQSQSAARPPVAQRNPQQPVRPSAQVGTQNRTASPYGSPVVPQQTVPSQSAQPQTGPGQLAGNASDTNSLGGLSLELPADLPEAANATPKAPRSAPGIPKGTGASEELPLPPALQGEAANTAPRLAPNMPNGAMDGPLLQDAPVAPQNLGAPDVRSGRYGASGLEAEEDRSVPPPSGHLVDQPSRVAKPEIPTEEAFQCNTRTFSLDYSVESLGGSTLSDVELWGTEDGGVHWQMWGKDPDRVSPFDVKVGNDGKFGFRMVVVGANGVVSNRPKAGDSADVWLHIDTSKPTSQITRAVYGTGVTEGKLVIDYRASDDNLAQQPVSILYRTNLTEQWKTIEQGLNASDTYVWQPPVNLPDKVYLKLKAIDRAGNIGEYELDEPIDIKGLAPRGRIHRVRPIR